ncbi:L,D-transpeptidase family protein [Rufibacter ruber]|uniref:L,D-transpeptidase family protein n=1 Tax=Rufibacter ruber TaxID=1783499 RepID=UPI0009EDBE94|nr:L,D-transpeptidase family protein [Rufibacter ruber]
MNVQARLLLLPFLLLFCASAWGQTKTFVPAVQIQRLKAALQEYQHLDEDNLWTTFPNKTCLRPGEKDPLISGLRTNLFLMGDLPSLASPTDSSFDELLTQAVKKFQRRHGLEADGVAGQATLEALNITPAQRRAQLALNLQRWQADSSRTPQPLVLVNLPEFMLHLLDSTGTQVWETQVVIGQTPKIYQTVPLESKISYLVVNPTWTVPQSIIKREIAPMLKTNPQYLAQNNMVVYRLQGKTRVPVSPSAINWENFDAARENILVVQQPGPHNALGRIKFMFANQHSIYLHDTPAKSLFSHPIRAYSHGCVRVQNPEKLGAYLLDQNWADGLQPAKALQQTSPEKNLYLPKPIPVKLAYYTSWVDDNGEVQFRRDLYQLDALTTPQPEMFQ